MRGTREVVASLKDDEPASENGQVFTVAGSTPKCVRSPAGRANDARNGRVR